MTWWTLAVRDRRALLAAATVIGLALGWRFIATPYARTISDVHARTTEQRALLSRELSLVAAAPDVPVMLARTGDALETRQDRLFGGPDPLAASAALVDYVSDHARASRVLVQATETRPGRSLGAGLVTLEIQLRAVSDLQGVLEFLSALEQGGKLVMLDQLVIQQDPRRATSARDEEILTVTAIVASIMRPVTQEAP